MNGPSAGERRTPLAVEGLEPRDLLSVLPALAARAPRPISILISALSGAANPRASTPDAPASRPLAFAVAAQGPFQTGRGRLLGQGSQTLISGETTSNMFRHGPFAMVFFNASDPSQPITGQAVLYNRTNPNFGAQVVLDLTADHQDLNALGLPTRMAWTVSGGGGIFTNSTGQGTVQIHYHPGGKQAPGVLLAGAAAVVFRGQIDIPISSQIFNSERFFA